MKGLIICGYPGVGKSAIAGWNNCIDLESSYFSRDDNGRLRADNWEFLYCKIALDLAKQGYTVLVSCHESVRTSLANLHDLAEYSSIPIVIFCPFKYMKSDWAIRLVNRYLKSNSEKDLRAFEGAIKYWETNMQYMTMQNFPIFNPASIDYDLRDYILAIRKRMGCDNDSKTSSSVDTMA